MIATFACALVTTAQNQTATSKPVTLKAFSHKTHLNLGNIARVIADAIDHGRYLSAPGDIRRFLNTQNVCEACHRGLAESTKVGKANMPQMADCLVCHNKIDPPDSCTFCHDPGPQLKPVNHTPDFLDSHPRKSLGLNLQTCAVCHGKKFTCLGCH